jgi:SAM-dependent methyltransferase
MYDQDFYDVVRDGAQASAEVIAPIVTSLLDLPAPRSLVDVGCGEGWWAAAFKRQGWDVTGVDSGSGAGGAIEAGEFVPRDLAGGLDLSGRRFHMAVCLEVAEHLPPERADSFIADLCSLAPVVLFSAAIPGQGGVGHLNEQWPAYWIERFQAQKYAVSGALRWRIWNDNRIENWYRQNLLLAAAEPARFPTLFDTPLAEPFPVVHPVLFDARRPQ